MEKVTVTIEYKEESAEAVGKLMSHILSKVLPNTIKGEARSEPEIKGSINIVSDKAE